jgi:hypothetical protein
MFLFLVYNSGTSEWWAANISPAVTVGGIVLLASGSWSSQATGDIVLSSYVGYRGYKIFLYNVTPVSNNVGLVARFSTNGGSSYDAGAGNYSWNNLEGSTNTNSTSDTSMELVANTIGVSNTAAQGGVDAEMNLLNPSNASVYSKMEGETARCSTTTSISTSFVGTRLAAQVTNAVRFLFTGGNIASGNYAVYGLT